jgi:hypothetical protein
MLFEILAALFFSTVHAAALPSPRMFDLLKDPFDTRNATFCWKRTRGRGFGEVPDSNSTCAYSLEKSWGLCYPSCGEFGKGRGPVCWGSCSEGSAFPHPCGGGCAKDAQACALNTISQIKGTFEVAYNLNSVIRTAIALGEKSVWYAISEELGKGAEVIFKEALRHILIKYFVAQEAEYLALKLAGAVFRDEDMNWTDFDPTGVTNLVEAFYKPMCKSK